MKKGNQFIEKEILQRSERVIGRVEKGSKKVLKKRILKKPTLKLPVHSPTKFVAELAKSHGQLIRDVPNPYADPVQDNRSQFFRESFEQEKRKDFGGFL